MFKRILEVKGVRTRKKRLIENECDQCERTYTRRYSKNHIKTNQLTFCSNYCRFESRKKNGISDQKIRCNNKKKYGVEYSFQLESNKSKSRKALLKKYGVEFAAQSKDVQEKFKKTCLKRYGVDHHSQLNEIKEKCRQTCLKKYGTNSPIQSLCVQEKFRQTCLKKYGVDNPWKSKNVQEKCRKTFVKRYGVEYSLQSKEIRKNCLSNESKRKAHQTMKQNDSYRKSNTENRFYDYLCEKFGKENVERQARINGWNIDFHVKTIDVYVQFDGIYWHGLDRPIELIKEFKNPRDKVIYKTYLRDKEQNEWFEKNKVKFTRVLDNKFMKGELTNDFFYK